MTFYNYDLAGLLWLQMELSGYMSIVLSNKATLLKPICQEALATLEVAFGDGEK